MRNKSKRWLVLVAVGWAWNCTETNIYNKTMEPNVANKITVSGLVCTDDPAQRQFPVKIMFIVDSSGSMAENDAELRRRFAVEEIYDRYKISSNYTFSIVKFAGEVKQLTEGYTRDLANLNEAVYQLGVTDPCANGQCRNWLAALSLASSIFTGDLLTSNPGTRSRTRYVFIFVVNGPPDPEIPPDENGCDEKCRVVRAVEEMVDFGIANGAAEVGFHTIQLDNQPGTCQGTPDPRFCNSTTRCPPNCAGSEDCQAPQRLCDNNYSIACSDGNGFCAGLGLGDCSPEWRCTGDSNQLTGCDGDSICSYNNAGQCGYIRVCSNDGSLPCLKKEDCCPTFACDDPNAAENSHTSELLSAMAFKGQGQYLRFSISPQLNFKLLNFDTTQNVFVKKAFMVTNANAKSLDGKTVSDSDGDGLADREEDCYSEILTGLCLEIENCDCVRDVWSSQNPMGTDTDPALADTDGDMLNDMLEMYFATVNLDPLRMDLPQACFGLEFPYLDRDGDGLNDCEENLLGTDPSLFDSDRDGYPDLVEFKSGTNYLQADHLKDSDMDGLVNGEEIETHLDPWTFDVLARSSEAYRYRVIDEGMRVVPFSSQPHVLSGVVVTDVSGRSTAGAGTLYYYPAGTTRSDGTIRSNPTLAWQDPLYGQPGLEVDIVGSGNYTLYAACSCINDCPSGCLPGEWCDPSGNCMPDQCTKTVCSSTEFCDSSSGLCFPDCTKAECGAGQRCDQVLGKCLTDRCLNIHCPTGQDCDTESGTCVYPPCQGWNCPDGTRLDQGQKPSWITVKVDQTQLPLVGSWCDGSPDNTLCTVDADCPADSICRIRESIVVGISNKNCISFRVKNITLVETLETTPGFGAGYNNVFVYFAQTPLDNPRAFSIFRATVVQIQFLNGKKNPDWAEVPLGDGDFFPIEER